MEKRLVEGVEVQRSSGNVYTDLGLAGAEKLRIKTGLVIEIRKAIRQLGLTQHLCSCISKGLEHGSRASGFCAQARNKQ